MVTVNVQDFGAVGDSVHDDTEAVRKAVVAARAGDAVMFPVGTYRVDGGVTTHIRPECQAAHPGHSSGKCERWANDCIHRPASECEECEGTPCINPTAHHEFAP